MSDVGSPKRRVPAAGRGRVLRRDRRSRRGLGLAALLAGSAAFLGGCQQAPLDARTRQAQRETRLATLVDAGLELYGSGEYALAARRFQEAAHLAASLGAGDAERRATTAECVAWLRMRRLAELAPCSERLERLQRHRSTSDPAVNTLIALGAIAGGRPLPPLRLPNAVAPLIRESAAARAPDQEPL